MAALVRRGASEHGAGALPAALGAPTRLMQPRAAMLHTSGGATTAATIASGSVTAAVTAGVTGVTAGVMAAYGLRAVAVSCPRVTYPGMSRVGHNMIPGPHTRGNIPSFIGASAWEGQCYVISRGRCMEGAVFCHFH